VVQASVSGGPDGLSGGPDGLSGGPDSEHAVIGTCEWRAICCGGTVMRKRRRRDPFRSDPELEPLPPIDPERVLASFLTSPELAGLSPADRELQWVRAFLDTIDRAGWSWNELDLAGLWAVLFDGIGWAIDRPPDDPARVARLFEAFVRFTGREYCAPHAVVCSVYLRSGKAALDIGRWMVPSERAEASQR